jgi:FkbM family methyltransferase
VNQNVADPSAIIPFELRAPDGSVRKFRVPQRESFILREVFEDHEYAVPLNYLRENPVILDFGAHVGTFSLYAKTQWSPIAIHCYEPFPESFDLLKENVSAFPEIHVHRTAVGKSDGTAYLLLNPLNATANTLHPEMIDEPDKQGRVRISVCSAGNEWDRLKLTEVDVLKIDVEGSEIDVLKSLGERLDRCRVVMVEYHASEYRREIDRLLPRHLLFGATVANLDRGTVKYVRENLFKRIRRCE